MISIITPVFNGEQYIEACLNQVIGQNCPDIEHIVIDGGSKDLTVDIINKYANKHPHIRWISERDSGQSEAMNKGIKLAKGDIISFLNVDDYYETENILRYVARTFQDLPIPSFLVGNCNVRTEGDQIVYVNKPRNLDLTNLILKPFKNYPYNPISYFYHKPLHDKVGFYDENEHYNMDLDFLIRIIPIANIIYINKTFGNFRWVEGTKTFEFINSGKSASNVYKVLLKHRKSYPGFLTMFAFLGFIFFKFYYFFCMFRNQIWKNLFKQDYLKKW